MKIKVSRNTIATSFIFLWPLLGRPLLPQGRPWWYHPWRFGPLFPEKKSKIRVKKISNKIYFSYNQDIVICYLSRIGYQVKHYYQKDLYSLHIIKKKTYNLLKNLPFGRRWNSVYGQEQSEHEEKKFEEVHFENFKINR